MNVELELGLERRIGKRSAAVIEKHLGITTVGGLLNYYPRRYLNRGELTPISELPLDEEVTLIASVTSNSTRQMRARKGSITDVVITDDGRTGYAENQFLQRPPRQGRAAARPEGHVLRESDPLWRIAGTDQPELPVAGRGPGHSGHGPGKARAMPIPVYPATANLTSWSIQKVIATLLDTVDLDDLPDPLPGGHLCAREIPAPRGGLPPDPRAGDAAGLGQGPGPLPLPGGPGPPVRPCPPPRPACLRGGNSPPSRAGRTAGSLRPPAAVHPDRRPGPPSARRSPAELSQDGPMNRLLQGEVGSGKTIVALRAMLQVVDAGGQAALLAPTEVLAAQHFDSIRRTPRPAGPRRTPGRAGRAHCAGQPAHRLHAHRRPQAGPARRRLRHGRASSSAPTPCSATTSPSPTSASSWWMSSTASAWNSVTPCAPRPASPTPAGHDRHPDPQDRGHDGFGDLETSVLDELPAGRAPITTHVVGLAENPGWAARIWSRSRRRSTPDTRSTSCAPRSERTTTATSVPAKRNLAPGNWRGTGPRASWPR